MFKQEQNWENIGVNYWSSVIIKYKNKLMVLCLKNTFLIASNKTKNGTQFPTLDTFYDQFQE